MRTGIAVVALVVPAAALLRGLARARWRRTVHVAASVPGWFVRRAEEGGLPVDPAWRLWRGAALGVLPLAVLAPPALALLAAALVGSAPFVAAGPLRTRCERKVDAALPGVLDAVARSLRSGASLRQALADAAVATPGRLGDDLHVVARATSAGIPLSEALEGWGRRCPRPGVLLAVAALCLAIETGGASARAVDGVAATLRRRLDAQDEALSLSAQARASAAVLAGAPLVVCLVTVVAGGPAARFLLETPLGVACLLAGLSLDGLGGLWMARLTRPAGARR
ncbi:MAG TPA: type II secretion system F family protein [Acidimicrobiales bacterium]|nr:type II secretion system F family protein [Acidimicrobiales bacterium]